MPLNTAIVRDGELVQLRWGDFHRAAMIIAASVDSGQGPFRKNTAEAVLGDAGYGTTEKPVGISGRISFTLVTYPAMAATPMDSDGYVLTHDFVFGDCMDGEIFELKAGDRLIAYRS